MVVALLPNELHHITSSTGGQQSVVDLKVYKRNQQFRILGCVKHGDSRVLRLHRCMTGSVPLLDTLICVQPSNLALSIDSPSPAVQPAHHTSAAYGSAAAAYMPNLVMVLTSTLGCRIYSMQTHARHASASPSLYLHTDMLQCAVRTHASNHSVVEVRCDCMQWRLTCRDGCEPGAWHHLPADSFTVQPGVAPNWLVQHLCTTWLNGEGTRCCTTALYLVKHYAFFGKPLRFQSPHSPVVTYQLPAGISSPAAHSCKHL